jgi:hypothetical protein
MESFTDIAVRMAHRIAREHGCTLAGFSLDDVEIEHDAEGTEIVHVAATIQITPVGITDEIPFQLDPA